MIKRLTGIALLATGLATGAMADNHPTKVPFALDWKFEGPSAAYFAAIDNGHFKAEGLDVEISAGKGSLDAIPKVATGKFPIGFADINSLIKFLDKNPGAPVTAVMMIYDKPPFAVVGRASQGVSKPKDLEGRVLGAPRRLTGRGLSSRRLRPPTASTSARSRCSRSASPPASPC